MMRFKKGNRWKSSSGELKYRTWRKMVFELNKRKVGLSKYYVCVKCNKKRKTTRVLHAHHIYSWNKFPSGVRDSSIVYTRSGESRTAENIAVLNGIYDFNINILVCRQGL